MNEQEKVDAKTTVFLAKLRCYGNVLWLALAVFGLIGMAFARNEALVYSIFIAGSWVFCRIFSEALDAYQVLYVLKAIEELKQKEKKDNDTLRICATTTTSVIGCIHVQQMRF